MSAPGEIHYARTSDGIDIAYTVFGEGPDLLVSPGFVTHLDLMWDFPFFEGIRALGERFRGVWRQCRERAAARATPLRRDSRRGTANRAVRVLHRDRP